MHHIRRQFEDQDGSERRHGLMIGLAAILFVSAAFASTSAAGELDELMKGIAAPKQQTVQNPQTSPAGTGLKNMLKDRTENMYGDWVKKTKIKDVLTGLPTSPVFITQLLMNAALPSVGDVLAKAMNQAQQGGQFQGGTLGSLSTLLSGAGGAGSSPSSSPPDATELAACLKAGADPEDCAADANDAMKNKLPSGKSAPPPLTLSGLFSNAGVDQTAADLLGDVKADPAAVSILSLSLPTKSPYSLIDDQRKASTASPPGHPLGYRILEASDGSGDDAGEFWAVLQEIGLPFGVYKMYWHECKAAFFGDYDGNGSKERCTAVDSLATLVAVAEALKQLGRIEAQLADSEAATNGWELVHGDNALFTMLKPYLLAARPRIQAMRAGLEASTGLTLQNYAERTEKLKTLAEAREDERLTAVRQRIGRR